MSRDVQIAVLVVGLLGCCLATGTAAYLAWWYLIVVPNPETSLVVTSVLSAETPTAIQTPLPTPMPSHTPAPTFTATATPNPSPTVTATPSPSPTVTATPNPSPTVVEEQEGPPISTPQELSLTTEQRLLAAELPQRDLRLLAERLRKAGPIPAVVHDVPPTYHMDDESTFWVGNMDTAEHSQISAVVRYVTPHLYVWVEDGLTYDAAALARSAERFERQIYPTTRAFFGSEWSPGVDNDPRLHILHSTRERMGNAVAGYYSSADEYSHLANAFSNEREMFYVSLDGMSPGTSFYEGVLAHEFQHMIHWANDRNEEAWVNEGCSVLAAYLNGYDTGGFQDLFVAAPDVQLTTWPDLGNSGPHYGGSYLFAAYFVGRFGEDAMKRVVANPANGIAGFDAVLAEEGLSFEDVFADWLIATYLDSVMVSEVRYTYPDHAVGSVSLDAVHDEYPVRRESTVHQYAADYVELKGQGDLLIEFAGQTQVRLVPSDPHSGQYAWWSNRGDESDATLTRAFDLGEVDQATLQVWMWYDIEPKWDYAYVEVSSDRGQTWDILPGPSTTLENPNGNSFGPAYTGDSEGWVEEAYDLSPYAGERILVRFEYVTDDAVNRAGWLIDDVRIPELGYEDDFEPGPGGWQAEGFVYSDNQVSQRYLVQLVTLGEQARVLRVPLDEVQRGRVELRGLGNTDAPPTERVDSAVLVISALAPVTTEIAPYEYVVRRLGE